jgi:hypothetical protein
MARRKQPVISDALLDQLRAGADAKTAFDKDGLLDELKKALAERALNAQMDHHLETGEADGNRRNGYGKKTVLTGTGKMALALPRHRRPPCRHRLTESHHAAPGHRLFEASDRLCPQPRAGVDPLPQSLPSGRPLVGPVGRTDRDRLQYHRAFAAAGGLELKERPVRRPRPGRREMGRSRHADRNLQVARRQPGSLPGRRAQQAR